MAQYVYTMNKVSKTVPPKRQILKDISLSFFPGAKIGVLGPERLGQVLAAQDHGRHRQGDRRRGACRCPASPSATSSRSPSSTPRTRCASRSRKRWARSTPPRRASKRCTWPTARKTPTSTRWPPSRPSSKPSSPPPAPTPSTSSRSPPTRCACRRGTPTSACSRAARSAAWRCAGCCCPSPTCCCSTNPPTTWTPNRSSGSKCSCSAFPAPWWPSPTIATSSTTRPSGFSNSTAAAAFRGRATTAPGSSRRANAWRRSRRARKPTPRR